MKIVVICVLVYALNILSEKAKNYSKWVEKLEKDKLSGLVLDDVSYVYTRDALKVLGLIKRVSLGLSVLFFGAIVLDFMFGRELSLWGVNYAGDFLKLNPIIVE